MKNLVSVITLFTTLFLFINCDTKKETNDNTNVGKVISIIDGDTYDILLDGNITKRIRMEGIDAPERGMPFYKVAKNYLAKLCFNKIIRIEIRDEDRHGRIIAYSYLNDTVELSHEMIKAGLAWHYKQYNSDKTLAILEEEARLNKKGIWSDRNPIAPWEIRKLHRQGISTKEYFSNNTNE